MAASDFKLNINWAFNLSRQSRQVMKEAKLSVDDINSGVKRFNELNEISSAEYLGSASAMAAAAGSISKAFNNLSTSISDSMQKAIDHYNEATKNGKQHGDIIDELKKKYSDFSEKAFDDARYATDANDKFADSIRNLTGRFEKEMIAVYGVGRAMNDQKEILERIAQTQAGKLVADSMNTASEALDKFKDIGLIKNEEDAIKLRESFVKLSGELAGQPDKLKDINDAIQNIDFSNMNPAQIHKMTEATVRLHEAIQNEESGAAIAKLADELNGLQRGFEKNREAAQKFKNEMSNFYQMLKGPIFRVIALGAVLEDSMSAQTEATKDIVQLNIRSSEAIARNQEGLFQSQMAYNRAMIDAGTATSSSLGRVQSTMNSLARLRVSDTADELGNLAEIGLQMEYAFGLSEGTSAELLKNMKLIGGMGTEEIRKSMDALAGVQDSMGLTREATSEVAATLGTVIRQMNALGGATDIDTVTREIGKMASAFESVGLSAQDASQMINNLMDPDKLADNTLLLNKMGMTAQDALAMMSGDGSQMEGMTRQMVGVAKDLKAQYGGNIYALKAMAEAHGMSLSQVQQLSQYDEERLNTLESERNLQEQATDARRGMNEALKQLGAQLNILMAQFILPMINFLSWLLQVPVAIARALNGLEGPLGMILKGFAGISLIISVMAGPRVLGMFIKGIFGLVRMVPLLGSGFGFVASKIGTMTAGLADFVGGPFKNLKDSASNIFNKSQKAIDNAADAASRGTGTLTKKIEAFGKAIKKIPPKTILAIGAAMLMIGGAIALVVWSITELVRAVGEAELMFTQLAGIAVIMLVVMGGMVAMLYALGAAAGASAIPLLAAGFAMIMIAGAVVGIVLSLTLLVKTIAESGASFGQLAGAALLLVPAMIGLAASLWLAAPAIGALGVAAATSFGPIMAFGVAILLIGLGIGAIVASMAILVAQISKLSGESVTTAAEGLSQISIALLNIAGAALAFGAAIFVFSLAMVKLAASATIGLTAIGVLIALAVVISSLGRVSEKFANNMVSIGNGMRMMADNVSGTKSALQELKSSMSGFEVPEGFNKIGRAFMMIGITAKIFGQDILLLGTGTTKLGEGIKNINQNALGMSEGVSSIRSGLRELLGMDLTGLISTFQVLGEATNQVAQNFKMMGEGISMMSQGLDVVVRQLESMIGVLSNNNLVGLSDNFNAEMTKINNSMRPAMAAGPEVQASTEIGTQRAESVRETRDGNIGTGAVVSELQVANTHLESMDSNIKNILNFMKDNKGSSGPIGSSTEVSIGR